jgi:hypothetical protein
MLGKTYVYKHWLVSQEIKSAIFFAVFLKDASIFQKTFDLCGPYNCMISLWKT